MALPENQVTSGRWSESGLSPCWNVFWKSSTLQENVAWLKMSQTARLLLEIGAVEITGFRQLFCCVTTLLCLWINQGLCQIGWKSKVKADHILISLSFVLSPLPGCLFSHRMALAAVEIRLQREAAVTEVQTLPLSPASLPGPSPAPHATCLCQAGWVTSLDGLRFSHRWTGGWRHSSVRCGVHPRWMGENAALRSLANNPWLMRLYCCC